MPISPTPWTVVVANDCDTYVCSAEELQFGLNPICAVDSEEEYVDDDAALIAAAPDLLSACRHALEYIDFGGPLDLEILRRAISKAEGYPEPAESRQREGG